MNNEREVDLPDHLLDQAYYRPVVYENNPEEVPDRVIVHEAVISEEENFIGVPVSYQKIPGIQHGTSFFVDNLDFKFYKREAKAGRM